MAAVCIWMNGPGVMTGPDAKEKAGRGTAGTPGYRGRWGEGPTTRRKRCVSRLPAVRTPGLTERL